MKAVISSAVAAVALISSATAIPTVSQAPRDLQRRWDAPPLPPCPQNDYTPFTYVGCFVEPNPETLQYNPDLVFSTMTVETCTATCKVNISPFPNVEVFIEEWFSQMDSDMLA
jgi:hypothetical protein